MTADQDHMTEHQALWELVQQDPDVVNAQRRLEALERAEEHASLQLGKALLRATRRIRDSGEHVCTEDAHCRVHGPVWHVPSSAWEDDDADQV